MNRSTLIASVSIVSLLGSLANAEEANNPVAKPMESSIQGTLPPVGDSSDESISKGESTVDGQMVTKQERHMAAEVKKRGEFEITRAATIDHPLVVLPIQSDTGESDADGWLLSAKEEDGFRIYQATRGDRVHTARVALSSLRHMAFNLATSRFEHLAPNVRVELRDPSALDQVVEAAGGTGGKAYPLLGFALVHLPADADPVSAAQSIRELPVVVNAWLTVKGPKREPR